MGRWAYFHPTDVEYKFGFGTQSSSDIQQFFGRDTTHYDLDYLQDQVDDAEGEEQVHLQAALDEIRSSVDSDGKPLAEIDEGNQFADSLEHMHEWSRDDAPEILAKLELLSVQTTLTVPDWTKYSELSIHDAHTALEADVKLDYEDSNHWLFWLGCVIYLQLLREEHLYADYEN